MERHPDSFLCPILGTLMSDPVMALDGHTYERSAIAEWFRTSDLSPLTGLRVDSKALVPNHALRKAIDEYCQGHPDRSAQREATKNTVLAVPATSGKLSSAKVADGEKAPWEFDKSLLATRNTSQKKPVIISTSRTSLYTGEGILVGFEPTQDGNKFEVAFSKPLKLEGKYESDASISSLCSLSDNTFVAGQRNGTVSVWRLDRNASTGKVSVNRLWQCTENKHMDETTCVASVSSYELVQTSASTNLIATGSRDRTVRLWRQGRDSTSWSFAVEMEHRAEVHCLTGSENGHIVSGGADWSLKMWDPNVPMEPVRVLDSHSRSVRTVCTEKSKRILASGGEDEQIIIWDPRASDPVVTKIEAASPVLSICFGENYLCAGGGTAGDSMTGSSSENIGGWLRFWDPRTWRVLSEGVMPRPKVLSERAIKPRSAHNLATTAISSFSLAGNPGVISGGDDAKLRLWLSPQISDDPFMPAPSLAYELGGDNVLPIAVDALVTMFV